MLINGNWGMEVMTQTRLHETGTNSLKKETNFKR